MKMTTENTSEWISLFETARGRLTGLAYRILGSYAEAQDVAQDTFVAWMSADRAAITAPQSWLTTVCSRKAIDALRSARVSRTDYVGAWLPEPIESRYLQDQPIEDDLAEAATMAFLVVLETLSPKERAAFVLRDVFGLSFADVAQSLGVHEAACRKLVSRARANIAAPQRARGAAKGDQEAMVKAFEHAISTGETDALKSLFAEDVCLRADSGGKVAAIRDPLHGIEDVAKFIGSTLCAAWSGIQLARRTINSEQGLVLFENGTPTAVISFGYDANGAATDVYITRNPDKLRWVG